MAYDAAKGRLWVVCDQCGRWNLSPLEERWEAIEEAERVYGDAKKRVATDNIGLARLRDGSDLIRIGAPLLPEFAAWRYAETFASRRRKTLRDLVLVSAAATVASRFGASAAGIAALGTFGIQLGVQFAGALLQARRVQFTVRDDTGRPLTLSRGEAFTARYHRNQETDSIDVVVACRDGARFPSVPERAYQRIRALSAFAFDDRFAVRLTGDNALQALSNLMPAVSPLGGTEQEVAAATELVQRDPSSARLLREMAGGRHRSRWQPGLHSEMLAKTTAPIRLALEMSLHEDDERRAMEGGLRELEQRWKEAEEIAAIADSLTLKPEAASRLETLQRRRDREGATE